MKKSLLFCIALLSSAIVFSQVSFIVNPPSTNGGLYMNTYANGADWGSPDMTNPANAVIDTMVVALDGTAADSLACNALVNGSTVSGKIAVLYRGACNFSTKALNAQNAGAVAVIIINNIPGDPTTMGAGTDGASVTIPVIMISQATGALLKAEVLAGMTTCFIGNKLGYFGDDIGVNHKRVMKANQFATPKEIATDANDFSVKIGAWVFNYGSNNQSSVSLKCDVTNSSGSLYSEISSSISINAGDSAYLALPLFSQNAYPVGTYSIKYSAVSNVTDEFDYDNTHAADFMITEDKYSYAKLDASSFDLNANTHLQPASFSTSFSTCMHFVDPNASRLLVKGVSFNATSTSGSDLTGEFISVEAYTWDDAVTDYNDANFSLSITSFIASADYTYASDLQDQTISVLFSESDQFVMEDDKHYLFCSSSTSQDIFLGFDESIDYEMHIDSTGNIVSPIINDGSYFALGFSGGIRAAALILMTGTSEGVGIEEVENGVEIKAFPNPAQDIISIPVGNLKGSAELKIIDMSGKVISTQIVNLGMSQVDVDVTNIADGMYAFNLNFINGKTTTFNVVIKK